MKKNSFLWAALSMTAALVMTACSNDDNTNVSPAQQNAAKTIPYTVTVNDGATTRAIVDSDNKTLKFAAGDKLYISGTNISGVLDIQTGTGTASATFSGDLTYTGSGTPADDLELSATLVGSSNVGVQITDGKVTGMTYPTTAFCTSVNDAVQKYSNLTGSSTYAAKSFSLTQQTAFLNCEITFEDGTTTGTELSAVVSNNSSAITTANVTTMTEETKVVAKFVLPVASGTTLSNATVTMGDKAALDITDATLAGKVYNVKRTQAAAGPVTYTELNGGEVLHPGDIIDVPSGESWDINGYTFARDWGSPYTVLRANVTLLPYDAPIVSEAEDGAYYVIKDKDGWIFFSDDGFLLPVTSTSDGILVTKNSANNYTFSVHEP